MSNRNFYLSCAAIFGLGIAIIFLVQRSNDSKADRTAESEKQSSTGTEKTPERRTRRTPSEKSDRHGIRRPAKPKDSSSLPSVGQSPLVSADANPSTKSLHEALENKEHPEQYSSYLAPQPFDAEKFANAPQAYLETIEPGRVYQSAQPGKDVPRIQIQSNAFANVVQGEKVFFRVKVNPLDPVTFHSSEMGEFPNRLSTITVRPDRAGIANVEFATTRGMQGIVNVLAASPRTSGQAHFYVNVNLPDRPADRAHVANSSN